MWHSSFLRSDAQHGLDGAALVHRAIALGDIGERQRQIEDLARIDPALRHQIHEVWKEAAHGSGTAHEAALREEKLRTVQLNAVAANGKPVIPVKAHIRLAAPATNGGQKILRRGYSSTDGTDQETAMNFAMDLTPLIDNPELSIADYVLGFVDRFRADVARRLPK